VRLAIALKQQGNTEDASAVLTSLIGFQESRGYTSDLVSTYQELGEIAEAARRLDEAETYIKKTLALQEGETYILSRIDSLATLGNLYLAGDRIDEAEAAFAEGAGIAAEHGMAMEYGEMRMRQAVTREKAGDLALACRLAEEALNAFPSGRTKRNWMKDAIDRLNC